MSCVLTDGGSILIGGTVLHGTAIGPETMIAMLMVLMLSSTRGMPISMAGSRNLLVAMAGSRGTNLVVRVISGARTISNGLLWLPVVHYKMI